MITVAFSGGKDSTAMALRLSELGEDIQLLHTATGNELPQVKAHLEWVSSATNANIIQLDAPTLKGLIEEQKCLPNWRMRWCTRIIKIEPCAKWLKANPSAVLAVGLRADEEGRAGGTYEGGEIVYPLREWGWDEGDVINYCEAMGANVPTRTDCAVCFYQTLYEWFTLWKEYPSEWSQGEEWEKMTGYTFRSPQRDSWPASMEELRKEFESGRTPQQRKRKNGCRICSL